MEVHRWTREGVVEEERLRMGEGEAVVHHRKEGVVEAVRRMWVARVVVVGPMMIVNVEVRKVGEAAEGLRYSVLVGEEVLR